MMYLTDRLQKIRSESFIILVGCFYTDGLSSLDFSGYDHETPETSELLDV